MKGFVFQEFFDFVDQKYGPETTEDVIDAAALGHDAAYAATGTYPFADLQKLVGAACRHANAPADILLSEFGGSVGCSFARGHAAHFERHQNLFDMLESVDALIHVEVRKLYPEAELPRFEIVERSADQLSMRYISERRLWDFAKGIIEAAAGYFGETVSVEIARSSDSPDEALITISKRR